MLIAILSGSTLVFLFIYCKRFPDTSYILVIAVTGIMFYLLSILLRVQNNRTKFLTGKTFMPERYIKVIFPAIGFAIGLAPLFF
ncbi:MAG: hypothetical protein C0619_13090 [Desulfuromonas sp.]|nr:MAG: hypothetical protein C0619_13090 [Desulfuromonas sp.]